MYKFHRPEPLVVKLGDGAGFELRKKAAEYINLNENHTGAERANKERQGFGALAEIVIRKHLGMQEFNPEGHPLGYDILLPSGVKVDVKCRGGSLPFKEVYESDDGIAREAKHNFYARQLDDERLDTDIYLMTHLETPSLKSLPGTNRQRKWTLYICGWVSKERVAREGVYLPRGSLTEQGRTWFTYRGQEIEFYNRNLNGLGSFDDLLTIDPSDVIADKSKKGDLNLTSVDAIRIAYDLAGRGIITNDQVQFVEKELGLTKPVKTILHANQYHHLLEWLKDKEQLTGNELVRAEAIISKEIYSGL